VLTDPKTHVQRIFVAEVIKKRLLDYASEHGAEGGLVARARTLLKQPMSGPVHDDHFHVRIACPKNQHVCVQNPGDGAMRDRTASR
jgi:penicillin-insensitive murein endopeptidase